MTLLGTFGFELGHAQYGAVTLGGSAAVASSSGHDMDGNYCLDMTGQQDYYNLPIAFGTSGYVGLRLQTVNIGNNIVGFYDSGTLVAAVYINGSGYIQAFRGGPPPYSGSLLATSTSTIVQDATYLIEIYYVMNDSTGTFQVRIDGVDSGISFTGDTKQGSGSAIDALRFGHVGGSSYGYAYIDNICVDDADWPGNLTIQGQTNDSAGANTNLTASTGSNYQCVDEIPPAEADYVYGNSNGLKDTYGLAALSGTIGTISNVQATAYVCKKGAAAVSNAKLVLRMNGTDYTSANQALPTSAGGITANWTVNPDDSNAFEAADISSGEDGVELAT